MASAIQTHPNFKSVVGSVIDGEGIDYYVGEALQSQDTFDRRTTPWEMNEWEYEELMDFEVIIEKIDRLYHISFESHGGDRDFHFIGRVEYEDGTPLYVEMAAGCDNSGFDCQGSGIIFVSRNANCFMRQVIDGIEKKDTINNIYNSLAEDGIQVEK